METAFRIGNMGEQWAL